MLKFFRHIRQNTIMDLPSRQAGNKTPKYIKYALGEIVLVVIGILIALSCPVRDGIWVKRTNVSQTNRAVRPARPLGRYGIWNLRDGIENHMAYLTARCNRFIHQFLPICSPHGTAQDFNHRNQNEFAC